MNKLSEVHERTTISLTWDTYQKLKRYGEFGDTFDQVLTRLLEQVDGKENR